MALPFKIARASINLLSRAPTVNAASLVGMQIRLSSTNTSLDKYEFVEASYVGKDSNIGLIKLNRPKALNALCKALMSDLNSALDVFERQRDVAAIIVTGSERAFAAGADIKEMKDNTYSQNASGNFLDNWNRITKCRKPVIAAVNGYALGGGCELAMMCDIIYAGDKARFGQPEVIIGTIPGAGGTQRIARSCGKSKAMEMCLTGNQITAEEAEKMGLVSKVFPADKLLEETIKLGEKIATHSPVIVAMVKESVSRAFETSLQEGLLFEKRQFHATFATNDQKEGMSAFVEKRAPKFQNS